MIAPQAFSTMTATVTATMTQVPTTRTATTNAPRNQLDKCEATQTQHKTRSPSILHPAKKAANYATQRNLLLYFVRNDPAITIAGLLLPHDFERTAITTTKNANFSLQLIVELLSTGTKQVAPANSKLHLIVVFIQRASTAQTTVDLISVLEGEHPKLHRAIQVKFRQAIHQSIQAKLRQMIQVRLCGVIQAKLHPGIHLATQAQLHQVSSATICNNSFKLIDTLRLAALCSEGAQPASTILCNELCGRGLIVDFIPTTSNPLLPPVLNGASALAHQSNLQVESKSKLIVICFKIFLHFHKDCKTFCEGERDEPGIVVLVDISDLGIVGHPGIGLVGRTGLGFISHVGQVGLVGLISLVGLVGLVGLVSLVRLIGLVCLVGFSLISYIGLGLIDKIDLGLYDISFVGLGLFGVNGLINVGFVGLVSFISLVGLGFIGLLGLIGFIGLLGLVGIVLNGLISNSIIAISFGLVCIQFEIEMIQSQHCSFVREKDVACANSYFLISLRPDSYFGDGIQHAKQLFFSSFPQMTKYFVMRECEDIPTWISLCCDSAFAHKKEFSIFKFPERFLVISCAEISLSWLHSLY
jgi:hypothetical protein